MSWKVSRKVVAFAASAYNAGLTKPTAGWPREIRSPLISVSIPATSGAEALVPLTGYQCPPSSVGYACPSSEMSGYARPPLANIEVGGRVPSAAAAARKA